MNKDSGSFSQKIILLTIIILSFPWWGNYFYQKRKGAELKQCWANIRIAQAKMSMYSMSVKTKTFSTPQILNEKLIRDVPEYFDSTSMNYKCPSIGRYFYISNAGLCCTKHSSPDPDFFKNENVKEQFSEISISIEDFSWEERLVFPVLLVLMFFKSRIGNHFRAIEAILFTLVVFGLALTNISSNISIYILRILLQVSGATFLAFLIFSQTFDRIKIKEE